MRHYISQCIGKSSLESNLPDLYNTFLFIDGHIIQLGRVRLPAGKFAWELIELYKTLARPS